MKVWPMDDRRWTMARNNGPSSIVPSLILASASPRRQEFLRLLGIPFRVHPAHVDETPLPDERPEDLVVRLSRLKAEAVAREETGLILAADTIVVLDGRILGKPRDEEDARAMLRALRGRWHQVHTAITLIPDAGSPISLLDTAYVLMRDYTDAEVDAYVATGDPLDKAGAYAIQNTAFAPVARVEGCLATVMGLPIRRLLPLLERFGVPLPEDRARACRAIFGVCCQVQYNGRVHIEK